MTTLTLKADRLMTSDRGRDTHFVLLELRAPRLERRRERVGLNLSLVLDRSGSMGGASKFPLAQKAVESAVARLDDRDRVSLVVYDDQIDVLMASAHATPAVRDDVRKALGAITPRGTTALFDGYLHGASQVAAHVEARSLGKVLLLTDGLANVGLQDSAEIARHVAELRARSVHTSTFGVGADFNQLLLEAMADAGGGSFYFVENGRQIEDLLTSEVGEALETVARDVRVTVQHPHDVQVRLLDAFPVERDGEATAVRLGGLTSEQVVELLFEIEVPAQPSGSVTRLDVAVEDAEHALKSPSGVRGVPSCARCRGRGRARGHPRGEPGGPANPPRSERAHLRHELRGSARQGARRRVEGARIPQADREGASRHRRPGRRARARRRAGRDRAVGDRCQEGLLREKPHAPRARSLREGEEGIRGVRMGGAPGRADREYRVRRPDATPQAA